MKHVCFCMLLGVLLTQKSFAQVWQWSVSVDSVVSSETNKHPQAYLWIPERCKQVRAVVFAQHNMIEEGILEDTFFRKTMSDLGIAEVWVTPGINMPFDFTKDAGEDFTYMMQKLALVSGYQELQYAPLIPLGHSAYATFPWNFAAWNNTRTLALISIHGDAPQTNLTGYGRANINWGDRHIDGVPALFVMGEYEWWEDRIAPAFKYISHHPKSAISLLCDAGHGHFDYSKELINYLCLFIKKSVANRLPSVMPVHKQPILKDVIVENGWLMDRWHKDSVPFFEPAKYTMYKGNRNAASWVFDKEMAEATEFFYAKARGKQMQYIGIKQNGIVLAPDKSHANYNVKFMPLSDGISFRLSTFFADSSRLHPVANFAKSTLLIDKICGPVFKKDDSTFQLRFSRLGFDNPKRSFDIWLLAHNAGDTRFKSAVQQLSIKLPALNTTGQEQTILFDSLPNIKLGTKYIALNAKSSLGLPVQYYVKQGPAFIKNATLFITTVPPKSRMPIAITIVAWQYGFAGSVKTAKPVERTFYLVQSN